MGSLTIFMCLEWHLQFYIMGVCIYILHLNVVELCTFYLLLRILHHNLKKNYLSECDFCIINVLLKLLDRFYIINKSVINGLIK